MRLSSCLLLLAGLLSFSVFSQKAKQGVIDLRQVDFESNIYLLDGEWEFCWSRLLMPGEFGDGCEYVQFPGVWSEIEGQELSNFGYATYRLKLVLPKDDQYYTLHVEDMFSSFRLFFNGKEIYANGEVGTNKESYTPQWLPEFVPLHHVKDTNELILQIANFDHRKGGSSQSIKIGESQLMRASHLSIWTYDLLLTGSLLIGGLFLLGLYFFGHHDRAIFYFALFCLTFSYRVLGSGFYELHHLLDWSWYLLARLEYISLFVSVLLFSKFVESLYPDIIKSFIFQILNTTCLIFTAATLLFPPYVFTYLMVPFLLVMVLYIAMAFYVYLVAYKQRLVGSEYAMLSTAVVLGIFSYNIMVYFGLLERMVWVDFWGKELFLLSQSLILSFRFAYTLKTEKKRAEIASLAKSDFLSTISHEIRTPLNAVVGLSHLLLSESPRKDQEESLTSLKYSAEHLTALINDILDYNKLESGAVELEEMEVDLHEMADKLLKVHNAKAEQKGLYLRMEIDAEVDHCLLLDATRFAQVMNNLIDNAVKFTREGGVIMKINLLSQDDYGQELKVEVEDTGVGVPEEKKELIFERFTQASSSTTREFGGSGLGLSIIRQLLLLQGSEIKVKSNEERGSTFYFVQKFPFGSREGEKDQPINVVEDKSLQGRRVLLVEDNKINIIVASKFLQNWGINVDVANNGLEAIQFTEEKQFDLILMDLQMPEMDGYEAASKIRERDADIPIIALTASALMRIEEGVKKVGMNDFITKPFDPQELKRKLAKYMV